MLKNKIKASADKGFREASSSGQGADAERVSERIIEKPVFVEKISTEQIEREQRLKFQAQKLLNENALLKEQMAQVESLISRSGEEVQQLKARCADYENVLSSMKQEKEFMTKEYEAIIVQKNENMELLQKKQRELLAQIQFFAQKNIIRNQEVKRQLNNSSHSEQKQRAFSNQQLLEPSSTRNDLD